MLIGSIIRVSLQLLPMPIPFAGLLAGWRRAILLVRILRTRPKKLMTVFATTNLGHGTLLNKIVSLSRSGVIWGIKNGTKCGNADVGGGGWETFKKMMVVVAQFSLAGVALFGLALKYYVAPRAGGVD